MENQQSVLDIIQIRYDSFFEQEKKIAGYILQNYKDVINMTIGDLADASGTSVATVSRFCRKCEVDGFHHLKIGLAKELVMGEKEVTVSNDISRKEIGQSLQNILANKIEEMRQTVSLFDEKQLETILNKIQHAGMVQFVAVGNTIPVALDGAYKLNEIGIPSMAGTIWETQLSFAMTLKKKDVQIAISNSGESKQVVKMVRAAKKNGCTTANYFETGVDETSGILLKNPDGEMAVMALTMRAKQPKRGVVAGEKGFIEIYDYPRAAKATITYTETGKTEVIEAGESAKALQYEVADMQDYVWNNGGKENLSIVRDVMETLTTIRNQWGMVYSFE